MSAAAFVRPQVGYAVGAPSAQSVFGFELMRLELDYRESHPQAIAFKTTREVVRPLTDAAHPGSERLRAAGRTPLFPQVLTITQR